MDNITIVAVVSIIASSATIAIGTIAPAIGEYKALMKGLEAHAEQESFCRNRDDRISGNLLPGNLDNPDIYEPVLELHGSSRCEVNGNRPLHLCRAGN